MRNVQAASQHMFAKAPSISRPRSAFDRSHGVKTTFDAGYLVPVFVDEALPGDTVNLQMTAFARLSTPLKPIMDNLYLTSFFFFVPLRLVWTNFQKFMGEQDNPADSIDFVTPKITSPGGGYTVGTVFDYMGLPTGIAGLVTNEFPLRAYNLIWNQWFRDENLQNSVTVDKSDGPGVVANYALLKRGKRHDYFTSALPWPQKGPVSNNTVALPLSGNAPVRGLYTASGVTQAIATGIAVGTQPADALSISSSSTMWPMSKSAVGTAAATAFNSTNADVFADLSAVTAATINQLRDAIALQQLYELNARGGTRYTEIVLAHFGVLSPDSRLQRAEYLGGSTSPVSVSPIAQMSATVAGQTPQANLAAVGTSIMRGHGFSKSFTEHGIIVGLVSCNADLTYQQGVNKMWLRSTKYDYYWPTLANLGEQIIQNQEIYFQGTGADTTAFGYQERWAEYRYKPSQICGIFRSTYATPLDMWHLAQKFTSLPALNATFIQEAPPISRIVAVTTEPNFIADIHFALRSVRAMPMYSIPGLTRL